MNKKEAVEGVANRKSDKQVAEMIDPIWETISKMEEFELLNFIKTVEEYIPTNCTWLKFRAKPLLLNLAQSHLITLKSQNRRKK
jgi:hypothetical protein